VNSENSILKEIKEYDKGYLENLLLDQLHNISFINSKCINCAFHSQVFYNNNVFHICNDIWSDLKPGKHVFYFETRDICIESDGFKGREK
jgi:hypothetical protein